MTAITSRLIASTHCEKDANPIFLWDDKVIGFGVRITATRKSYIFRGRIRENGKQKIITIAPCSTISPEQGRQRAKELDAQSRSVHRLG